MALIQSLTSRRFRTRDPGRDAHTDQQRLDTIRLAVTDAIESATKERAGLKRRVDDYYAVVSQIVDNSDYEERSARQEREASEAERQGRVGLTRLARLDAELERYQQILTVVDGIRDAAASSAA